MTITTTTPDQQESTQLPVEPPSNPAPEPVEAPKATAEVPAVDTADLTPAAPFDPNKTQEIDMSQVERERRDVIQDLAKQVAYLEKARAHLVKATRTWHERAEDYRKNWLAAIKMIVRLADNRTRTIRRAAAYRAQIARLRHDLANAQSSILLLQKTAPAPADRPVRDLQVEIVGKDLLIDDLKRDLESALKEVEALKAAQGKPQDRLIAGHDVAYWYRVASRLYVAQNGYQNAGSDTFAATLAKVEAKS